MDAKIIAFPGCASVPQPPVTPDEESFEQWCVDNVGPLLEDVSTLDQLATEDRAAFWAWARYIRDALTAWPYPDG